MRKRKMAGAASAFAAALLALGTLSAMNLAPAWGASESATRPSAPTNAVAIIRPAPSAAATQPANADVHGRITFAQTAAGVKFVADIDGLAPNSRHAFHIHEHSDLSKPDLTSAGKQWKAPHDARPHGHTMSDLGVLSADAAGHAHAEGLIDGATLAPGDDSIVGHAVIIHANPPGRAGPRIAGGAIEPAP